METKYIQSISYIGIGLITSQIIGLFFFIILARSYSVADYGYIMFVISAGSLLASIVAAGYPSALSRYIAKYQTNQELTNEYYTNILTASFILLFTVLCLSIVIFGFNIAIIFVLLGYSIVYLYSAMIRGFIDVKKISIFNLSRNFVVLVAFSLFFFIFHVEIPLLVIFIYAFSGVFMAIILECISPAFLKFSPKLISKEKIKETSLYSIPIMISVIAFAVITNIPVIILKFFYDFQTIGHFSTAITLTSVFGFIASAIVTITMPMICKNDDKASRIKFTMESFWLVLFTGIFGYLILIFFGEVILTLLFSEKYLLSYPILLVAAVGGIFAGLRNVFCALWEGMGQPVIATYDILAASLLCVTLSWILIPKMGAIGAAYGYSIGMGFAVFVDILFWIKYVKGNTSVFQ